jgi:hypothetical protein
LDIQTTNVTDAVRPGQPKNGDATMVTGVIR